jgi:hypothetical protein
MAQGLLNRLVLRSGISSVFDKVLLPAGELEPFPLGPPPGTVTTVQGPGSIGFRLNGVLRWLIDMKLFAGSPTLATRATPQHGLRIELKGARFPGTELPADFVCVLQPKSFLGTPMEIAFTLGGFHGQVVWGPMGLQGQVPQSQECAWPSAQHTSHHFTT